MGKRIVFFMLGLAFAACTATPEPSPTQHPIQRLATSPSMRSLVVSWMEAYAHQSLYHGDLFLEVLSPESLLSSAEAGEVDLAIVAEQPPAGWFATPLGRQPIAIVLHPDNPHASFTFEELAMLFNGKVRSWDVFGQKAGEVLPLIPIPGDPFRERFAALVLDGQAFSPFSLLSATPEMLLQRVSELSGGIGFLPLNHTPQGVKVALVGGAHPGASKEKTRDYPLWVEIVATAPKQPEGSLYDFLLWLQSTYLPDLPEWEFPSDF